MNEYLEIFIDDDYPEFIDKYLNTKTMQRIKNVTQFCGSDYSGFYTPRFLYTRFDHSIVVSLMTWHFTHNKKETIAALLHDTGTPCFAHCIDYVFGDYFNQESSEKKIASVVRQDEELLGYLKEDEISPDDLDDLSSYPILENKSPKLCTDRLDGVLHTCYVWLHTHSIEEIKEVYDDLIVLENEEGKKEIGFKTVDKAERFTEMTYIYAKELRGNEDKYVMEYIAELVKEAVSRSLISIEDLYTKKEEEICEVFAKNFTSWHLFKNSTELERDEEKPLDFFSISFDAKKRNTIPLVASNNTAKRIDEVSPYAREIYKMINEYKDSKYAYVKTIRTITN